MPRRYPYRCVTSKKRGKPRPTLLYVRYRDMRQRCKGKATKNPEIYAGLQCEFQTFGEFRAWALVAGFSKQFNSPDRIDNALGYIRSNIRFNDPRTNTLAPLEKFNAARRMHLTGHALDSVTKVTDYTDVPF